MIENIGLSLKGIWSHKMRSFLTMLGIIIGIASIIAIVSTIKGTNEQIKQNLIGSGNNVVQVKLSQDGYEVEGDQIPYGTKEVSPATLKEIKAIEHVEGASLYRSRSYVDGIYYKSTLLEGPSVKGIDEDYFNVMGYVIRQGRLFIDSDYQEFRKNMIIDQDVASSLFQSESPIGQTLEIRGEPFIIIGVVELANQSKPVIHSIDDYYTYHQNQGGNIFLPDVVWPVVYAYDEPQHVAVKASHTDYMGTVGRDCANILNAELWDSTLSYQAIDILEQAKQLQELSAATNQQLLWIASISLLVGGIGVMNIMLVSVTERTNEIGLKKAIGARKRVILAQFLTEAAVLTSLGGILGILAGIILAKVISVVSQTPVAISLPATVGSVVFSIAIGLIFGLLPSMKAANLNPIDALRHE